MSKTASKTTRKTGPISHCYQAMLNFVSTPLACSCSSSFQLSSALQASSPRCSTLSLTHCSCYSQSLRQYWPTFVSFSPWTPRTSLLFHTLHHALIWVAPNLLQPVESRHMFVLMNVHLYMVFFSSTGTAPKSSSSYSFPWPPQSIAFSLVLRRWFYLSLQFFSPSHTIHPLLNLPPPSLLHHQRLKIKQIKHRYWVLSGELPW